MADLDARQREHHAHDIFDAREERPDNSHEGRNKLRDAQRRFVGMVDRQRFRQNFGEDEQQHGHDDGRIHRAIVARDDDQHARGESGAADIDQGAAKQQRGDHAVALAQQPIDGGGALIALFFQRVHPGVRRGGERRLRSRKDRRQEHADDDDANRSPYVDLRRAGFEPMHGAMSALARL